MMKVVVALCVLIAVSQAAHQSNWYAGSVNTTGTPQARPVDTTNTAGCTLLAGNSGYRNFTVNVTSAGFYYFTALFEKVFKGSAQIQVYSANYNPADACANLVTAVSGTGNVPHVEFVRYFTPGLYPVVITGADNTSLGLFAIHVDATTLNGAVNEVSSNYAYGLYGSSATCSSYTYKGPYIKFNYFQNGTATNDILVFGYNASVVTASTWYFSASLFNSTVLPFLGQGNFTDPVDVCDNTTQSFVYGIYSGDSDLAFNLENTDAYQAAAMLGLGLTTRNYSIVVSTSDSTIYNAIFGVFIRPTFLGYVGQLANFDAPQPPSRGNTFTCSPGSVRTWAANPFTAQYNAYILDNPGGSFFDASGSLYKGYNLGNATAPPVSCPGNTSAIAFIQCGDTGDGGPVANFLIPGVNYTWVQYGYSGAAAGAPYLLYNYSGKLLGSAPVTTTGPATTGPQTSTGMDMSTSSASSVVVMFALYIAALLF